MPAIREALNNTMFQDWPFGPGPFFGSAVTPRLEVMGPSMWEIACDSSDGSNLVQATSPNDFDLAKPLRVVDHLRVVATADNPVVSQRIFEAFQIGGRFITLEGIGKFPAGATFRMGMNNQYMTVVSTGEFQKLFWQGFVDDFENDIDRFELMRDHTIDGDYDFHIVEMDVFASPPDNSGLRMAPLHEQRRKMLPVFRRLSGISGNGQSGGRVRCSVSFEYEMRGDPAFLPASTTVKFRNGASGAVTTATDCTFAISGQDTGGFILVITAPNESFTPDQEYRVEDLVGAATAFT